MNKWKKTIAALFVSSSMVAASANAEVVDFDITINFAGGLTASQQAVFGQAELFWEDRLIGYADNISFPGGLVITAQGAANDGVGGVLGSAGPTTGYQNSGANDYFYASTGQMSFDSADLGSLETQGTLFDVILHEMAHVIGFGTLWSHNNVYTAGTGQYTGQYALAAYQAEFDSNATYIPIELDGGAGTADGHWDETWAGPQSEMLTGYLEGETTLSQTSLASFRDLGYAVFDPDAPSEPVGPVASVSAPIGLGALMAGLVFMSGRRRKED